MVIALIRPAIAVATQVYKHRKAIYAVLTAQDRYISNAFRYGGYGKATSYGVRSGALAGSVIGAFITNEAEDTPGNGVPKTFRKQPKTSKPYKTRSRPATSGYSRNKQRYNPDRYCRRTNFSKYSRS